jgi:hypothetical protein
MILHRRYDVPARASGDYRRGLTAVGGLVVGQEDDLRPGRNDVLLRQFGVAAVGCLAGGVRDVLQPEHRHDLADERLRGHRVIRVGAQLPVIGQVLVSGSGSRHVRGDLRSHRAHRLRCLGDVAGCLADLLDLGVDACHVGRRGLDQYRDAELGQAGDQAADVLVRDYQVGPVPRDRLDVGSEAAQAGLGHTRRVVGVGVHRDHLAAGANGVQVFGGGRGQRDDAVRPGRDRDLAIRGAQGHRVAATALDGGRCAAGRAGPAACEQRDADHCGCADYGQTGVHHVPLPPESGMEGETAGAMDRAAACRERSPFPRGLRAFSAAGGDLAWAHAGDHSCGTAPEWSDSRTSPASLPDARASG